MDWQRSWLKSKNDPPIFVTEILGAKPEPWQAEALEAIGRHERVSIRSGHGVGKTTFESWLILWFLLTHKNCRASARPRLPLLDSISEIVSLAVGAAGAERHLAESPGILAGAAGDCEHRVARVVERSLDS
jgi:hypothetical protein